MTEFPECEGLNAHRKRICRGERSDISRPMVNKYREACGGFDEQNALAISTSGDLRLGSHESYPGRVGEMRRERSPGPPACLSGVPILYGVALSGVRLRLQWRQHVLQQACLEIGDMSSTPLVVS
jgi:hypothetical protein